MFEHRFRSNKCLLINDVRQCINALEVRAMQTLKELIHETYFVTSLDLDGDGYSIFANSKTEESLIFLSQTSFKLVTEEGNTMNKIYTV